MSTHRPSVAPPRVGLVRFAAMAASMACLFAPTAGAQTEQATRAYFTANGLLNRGLHEEAAAEYRAFLSEAGDASERDVAIARYGLAVSLAHTGQPSDAITQLEQIDPRARFPFAFEAGILHAQLLYAAERFDDAAGLLRPLVRSDSPKAADAGALWIECLYRLGKTDQAVRAWADLRERSQPGPRATLFAGLALHDEGQRSDAIETLSDIIDLPDDLGRQARLVTGQWLLDQGELEAATPLLEPLTASDDPRWSVPASLGMAAIHRATGDPQRAVESLESLVQRISTAGANTAVQLERGISLVEAGRVPEALETLDELASDGDASIASAASYWLAKASLRSQDPAAAVRILAAASEQHAESLYAPQIMYDLGVALYTMNDPERAIRAFDLVLERFPRSAVADPAHLASAKALLSLERFDEAAKRAAKVADPALQAEAELIVAQTSAMGEDPSVGIRRLERWLREHATSPSADQARYQLALAYASAGEIDDAERALEPLIQDRIASEFVPVLLVVGDAAANAEQWKRAERWYRLALEHDTAQRSLAQLKLGLALSRLDRPADAVPLLEQAADAEDQPTAQHALFELGQSHVTLHNDASAAQAFEALLRSDPNEEFTGFAMLHLGEIAERMGEHDEAAEWYHRAVVTGNTARADASRQRARVLLAAGEYRELLDTFASSDEADIRAYVAIAFAREGDCDRASAQLERLLSHDSLSASARRAAMYELAWCARAAGDRDAAIALIEQLTADVNDRFSVYAALDAAAIELERDKSDAAGRWLRTAEQVIKDHSEAADASARGTLEFRTAQLHARRNRFENVLEQLDGFADRYPSHDLLASAHLLRGDALLEIRRPRNAASAFDSALESAGGVLRPVLLLRAGDAHARAQSWDASRLAYETFLRENADSDFEHEALFGLGWALEHLGDIDAAREQYARVVEHHTGPTAARAQFQIGEGLFAQKRYDEAVRELLRVDILYDYPEWSAAALYEAGRAFEQLRKIGEAREQYRDVFDRFADTQWAPLSSERLEQLTRNR